MADVCASCGAPVARRREWAMPIGRAIALIGGLALVAAYAMPWFGVSMQGQGITLSGQFLGRFLSSTNDLRRFMPGAAGGPQEVQMLRALVYLFPACGVLAALLAAATAPLRRRGLANGLLGVLGVVPLLALVGGLSQLPPGSVIESGLYTIGAGAVAILVGALLDVALARRTARP